MREASKKKMVRVVSITMAVLMVLGVGWTAVTALMSSKAAGAATYPPLLRYDGAFYMLTNETVDALPEGDTDSITAESIGSQEVLPMEDGACNFGRGTITFEITADGTVYCGPYEGSYILCRKAVSGEESGDASI